MRLGIMQGRLSLPDEGFQECPTQWANEFALLESLGLSHIDWVVTKKSFTTNPLFNEDVSSYAIGSICADNLIDLGIAEAAYLAEQLGSLISAARNNSIKTITIPLLEDSDMSCDNRRQRFCQAIQDIGSQNPDILFSFEAELPPEKILEIVEGTPNFFITYDTGNITSCGFDHENYIPLTAHKISCVHLKDRTTKGETVVPGTGDTNFKIIFEHLKDMGYNGTYTLQTAREEPGAEQETINKHATYFRELYLL